MKAFQTGHSAGRAELNRFAHETLELGNEVRVVLRQTASTTPGLRRCLAIQQRNGLPLHARPRDPGPGQVSVSKPSISRGGPVWFHAELDVLCS